MRSAQKQKSALRSQQQQQQQSESPVNTQVEEAEQRYSVAVEQPVPQHHPRSPYYRPQIPYHIALQQQQQQLQAQQQQHQQQQQAGEQTANQPQQQYQIIPEEQFLKILEEELQARAYQEDQVRRQQHAQAQQAQAAQSQKAAAAAAAHQPHGLGHYRQRIETDDEQSTQPQYVQYQPAPRPRGGPKYLPLPQNAVQEQQQQQQEQEAAAPPPLPPQIAYYQPQVNYKTLANHPLAKSSLEKEIENLFASNKPHVAPVQIVDNSNEPSVLINHHQHHHHRLATSPPTPAPTPPQTHAPRLSKSYVPSTAAPNSIQDANNQPFIPSSLFRFSNYPQPSAQNYPSQSLPQHVVDAKKLGPVVYPPPSGQPPVQASQFYYQETLPSPRPKAVRQKYGTKFATTPTPVKTHQNEVNYPTPSKYARPVTLYDLERPTPSSAPSAPAEPTHFYPSPPDPHRNIPSSPTAPPTSSTVTGKYSQHAPTDLRQYSLPGSSPSQSSIYVSQGTGIATPSRPVSTVKPKTIEDLKQLHLPQPGGKPLTQAEFQALVDAGYPVTAVPVPIPVPYEQYVKDHPDYRNQPPPQPPALPVNYEQLMRFAQLQQHQVPSHHYGPQRAHQPGLHTRSLVARPSEPSVKIISSPSEPQQQTVSAIGGGSVTYLRAIPENAKRRPRDESETKVLGAKEDDKKPVDNDDKLLEKREVMN